MADFEYNEVVGAGKPVRAGEVVAVMNWLGALVSIALIAGLAFWGYKLMVRDVTGVPVVRALEGPMRVAPENPGGLDAEHQGLAVNKIAAEGEAAPPAERLVLAPSPTSLADEDSTAGELAEAMDVADTPNDALATDLAVAEALTNLAEADEPTPLATESFIAAAGEAVDMEADTQATIEDTLAQLPEGVIPSSIAGVTRSPRPSPRPAAVLASLAAAPVQSSPNAVTSVDPATIPTGTRLAQLGAFESPEIAEAEWAKLAERFEEFMGDKSRVIQKAESGGKSFYRLRAMGFEDISDARRFCSTLLAGKAACIPVITR